MQHANKYNPQKDAVDLGTKGMGDLSIFSDDSIYCAIYNGKSLSAGESRIVRLGLRNTPAGHYKLNAGINEFENVSSITLVDNFLNRQTDIADNPLYEFDVTGNAMSGSAERFYIVFNSQKETTIVDSASSVNESISLMGNPSGSLKIYFGFNNNKVQIQLVDAAGNNTITTQTINNVTKGQVEPITTPAITPGVYFVRIIAEGKQPVTLRWMKQ
jgi:hypothetical protein